MGEKIMDIPALKVDVPKIALVASQVRPFLAP